MAVTYYVSTIQGTTLDIDAAREQFLSYICGELKGVHSGFHRDEVADLRSLRMDYVIGSAHIAYEAKPSLPMPTGKGTLRISITSFSPIDDLEAQVLKAFNGKPEIATISVRDRGTYER